MVEVENSNRNTTNKWDTVQQNRLFMFRNGDCSSAWDLLSLLNDANAMVQEC